MNRIDVLNIFTKSVLVSLSFNLGLGAKKSWSKDQIIEVFIGQDYASILEQMNVEQLQIILEEVQLSKSGKKVDLIQRIVEHETKDIRNKKPMFQQNKTEKVKPMTTKKKKCPACNSEQDLNAKFCNQCGNQFPKSKEEIQKCYQDWVHEFLEGRWNKRPNDPYDAFMCFGNWILKEKVKTDRIKVYFGYNPQPDDEGTYLPVLDYSIETPVVSEDSYNQDPIYGGLDALDDIYSGPAVSSLLSKLGTKVRYTDYYSLEFEVFFDASVEREIHKCDKEGKDIPFSLYAKCFSFGF